MFRTLRAMYSGEGYANGLAVLCFGAVMFLLRVLALC